MTERWSSVWQVLAAWYERPGEAADVLQVGEMADPEPGPGEVRVRVAVSGINPGDTKKRGDWVGYGMPYPRVIPHSDGAGVIDAVGDHVDPRRSCIRGHVTTRSSEPTARAGRSVPREGAASSTRRFVSKAPHARPSRPQVGADTQDRLRSSVHE